MDTLSPENDRGARTVLNYEKLGQLAEGLKAVDHRLVVTIGTYDLVHIGHARYLEVARAQGHILIVGVDSDRAVKIYKKDPSRPMVPEVERMEMLLHTRPVDYVTLVDDVNEGGSWEYGLLKAVQPQVFVAVEDSYPEQQLEDIREFCGEVVILPRQAETSTSEQIRRTVMVHNQPVADQLHIIADKIARGEL
jgi:rfaE bifunctional protein nucleotidyltransferase chain/domain